MNDGDYRHQLLESVAALMHRQRQLDWKRLPFPTLREACRRDRRILSALSTSFDCLKSHDNYRQLAVDEAEAVLLLLEELGALEARP